MKYVGLFGRAFVPFKAADFTSDELDVYERKVREKSTSFASQYQRPGRSMIMFRVPGEVTGNGVCI